MSPNDIEMSRPVDFMSCSVDFVSHPVDFRARVAASVESLTLDVTHHSSSISGKTPRNRSAICDQKVSF